MKITVLNTAGSHKPADVLAIGVFEGEKPKIQNILGEKKFRKDMESFLSNKFPTTRCEFKPTPSYFDTLLELADFISNTFWLCKSLRNHFFKNRLKI